MRDHSYRALVVEADADDRRRLMEMFDQIQRWTPEVVWVSDYQIAVGRPGEPRLDLDVALVDDRFHAADYDRSIMASSEAWVDLPVVVLTGLPERDAGVASLESGAVDFVPKEALTPEVLERTIRYAVENHRRHGTAVGVTPG